MPREIKPAIRSILIDKGFPFLNIGGNVRALTGFYKTARENFEAILE